MIYSLPAMIFGSTNPIVWLAIIALLIYLYLNSRAEYERERKEHRGTIKRLDDITDGWMANAISTTDALNQITKVLKELACQIKK